MHAALSLSLGRRRPDPRASQWQEASIPRQTAREIRHQPGGSTGRGTKSRVVPGSRAERKSSTNNRTDRKVVLDGGVLSGHLGNMSTWHRLHHPQADQPNLLVTHHLAIGRSQMTFGRCNFWQKTILPRMRFLPRFSSNLLGCPFSSSPIFFLEIVCPIRFPPPEPAGSWPGPWGGKSDRGLMCIATVQKPNRKSVESRVVSLKQGACPAVLSQAHPRQEIMGLCGLFSLATPMQAKPRCTTKAWREALAWNPGRACLTCRAALSH